MCFLSIKNRWNEPGHSSRHVTLQEKEDEGVIESGEFTDENVRKSDHSLETLENCGKAFSQTRQVSRITLSLTDYPESHGFWQFLTAHGSRLGDTMLTDICESHGML